MSVPLVTRAGPTWRVVLLVIVGICLAAVVAQPALARLSRNSPDAVTPAGTTAQWASCPGVAFHPDLSTAAYSAYLGGLMADNVVVCGLALPHRTTLTAVNFQLYDTDATADVSCGLARVSLDPLDGSVQVMAASRSGIAFHSGFVVKTARSINYAQVNDRKYAYLAQCYVQRMESNLELYGVSVRYVPG